VKKLVLSHLVPADAAGMTEQKWADAVRPTFQGELVVAHDLMEILL
jgi:ribonuclease BN (tRNA processing enzyme)